MRILVTNDDGIYSPGILALARAAQRFGDVRVVAPDVEQSSMGQAITSTRPLSYRATKLDGIEAYRVNGTPAGNSEPDFDRIDPYVRQVLECLLRHPDLPLVNVNFPRDPKGLRWTRQSVRYYDGAVVPGEDPMGRKHFWLTVRALEGAEEGTDLWAVREGYVSLTPLRLDLTDHAELTRVVREIPLD
jgi:5'-nucleotidase